MPTSTVQRDTDLAARVADAPRSNGHGPNIVAPSVQPGSDPSRRVDRQASSWPIDPIAVLAGFVGTVLAGITVLVAYAGSLWLGAVLPDAVGGSFAALTRNAATEVIGDAFAGALTLHFVVGLLLALGYGAVVPRLSGPGWRRGVFFALAPWTLSVGVLLPALGGGPFGLGLGAGLLPAVGNLVAHVVYGAALGAVYTCRGIPDLAEPDEASALACAGAERGIVIGVVVGGALGGAAAVALGLLAVGEVARAPGTALLVGTAGGATLGGFVGSFLGLSQGAYQ
ncbi:MAG TPA: DUF6789 family protein [Chloroflexota bacterium]|nr:DUF6789 family protein [Chloroflexota bacterium]